MQEWFDKNIVHKKRKTYYLGSNIMYLYILHEDGLCWPKHVGDFNINIISFSVF